MSFLRSAPAPTSGLREAEIFSPGVPFASSVDGRPNPRSGSAGPGFGAGGQVHKVGPSYEVGAPSGAILGAGPASGSGVKGDQVLGV